MGLTFSIRVIITVFCLIFNSLPCWAEKTVLDDETRNVCNQVILDIFKNIQSTASRYEALENFSESALAQNADGLYSINYSYGPDSALNNQTFQFGVMIIPIDEQKSFSIYQYNFSLDFPLLGLKLLGYQGRSSKEREINLQAIVREHGRLLITQQQKFMPIQLKLEPSQSVFRTGENIEFKVILTNNTEKNMLVKKLSQKSLSINFNRNPWDTDDVVSTYKTEKNYILKKHESISKKFTADPVYAPKEIEISASYGLAFKGVYPYDSIKFTITK